MQTGRFGARFRARLDKSRIPADRPRFDGVAHLGAAQGEDRLIGVRFVQTPRLERQTQSVKDRRQHAFRVRHQRFIPHLDEIEPRRAPVRGDGLGVPHKAQRIVPPGRVSMAKAEIIDEERDGRILGVPPAMQQNRLRKQRPDERDPIKIGRQLVEDERRLRRVAQQVGATPALAQGLEPVQPRSLLKRAELLKGQRHVGALAKTGNRRMPAQDSFEQRRA